jgi:uncharacterized protein YcbK (DUF882 family)
MALRRQRSLRGGGFARRRGALIFAIAMTLPLTVPAYLDAERTISFYNLNTKETLTVTYKKDDRYLPEAMTRINHMLRDWRRDEAIRMDPELVDLIYTIHQELGSKKPIGIVSGYRSPATNDSLRRRSSGVAKHSQHTLGKAIDIYFTDVPLKRLREAALVHQKGGVGYYPTSGRPFVHVDTGRVRHWPRLPRQELARLFPDGDTLHIPADGRPLARKVRTRDVQVARADNAVLTPPTPPSRPGPADRDARPDRPVLIPRAAPADRSVQVARAAPSAPARGADDEADSGSQGGFLSSLFGFKTIEEPDAKRARPQDALVAGLQPPSVLLPEGSSAPIPSPRPELELAAGSEDEPSTTASLPSPPPADSSQDRPLTIASLLEREREPANGNGDEPLTTASLPSPSPAASGEDRPVTLASLWERPEPADGDRQPVTFVSRWQTEPEHAADGGEDQLLAAASLSEPEPPEPVDSGEDKPLTLASLWEQGPEPADSDHQPLVVASRLQLEPEPAGSSEDRPPSAASPPPARLEKEPGGPPMVLASLGPAPRAPATERPVFKRDAPGIWTGGMSYEPPALDPLVANWRVRGEAFAAFTAPDQVHLASLTRAPEQSLSIRFAHGAAQTPYAEAFVGAAVAPIEVAERSAPIVTAAR